MAEIAKITDYATLKAALSAHLVNTTVADGAAYLIQLAEGRLRDDFRVRSMTCVGTFTIDQDGETLPSDFAELESWYHDGPTYFGPIELVNAEQLAVLKARFGETGCPRYVAITNEGTRVFFAPEPDGTYVTRMSYRRALTELSDSNTSNWLLDDHPHVYLYAALCESAPWLKDDERLPVWEAALETRIANMFISAGRKQFGGRVRGRPRRAIGG